MTSIRRTFGVLTITLLAGCAAVHADQVNVDFDAGNGAPPSDYGAAGIAGFWNAIGEAEPADPLFDLAERPKGITLTIMGEPGNIGFVETPNQETMGSDALLLRDYAFSTSTGIHLRFVGLSPSQYIVTTYAVGRQDFPQSSLVWMNDDMDAAKTVEGLWNGGFEEGVTHVNHILMIEDGILDVHIQADGDAFVNGIQFSQLPAPGAGGLLVFAAAGRRRRRA